jgi:hypothetical protein
MLRRSAHVLLAMSASIALVAVLAGCGSGATTSSAPTSASALYSVAPAPLTQMTPAEKRSEIASSFPMQIPVPQGAVESAEAQGPSAWVYSLVVPGEPDRVARWYMDVFLGAEWTLVASTERSLELQKNRAQAQLKFEAVKGTVPSTKVTASIGVGTSVLNTQ